MRSHDTAPASATPHMALATGDLGRPMHLLGQFNALLHEDLSAVLRYQINARCGELLRLGDIRTTRLSPGLRAARWMTFTSAQGRVAFHTDRPLLLTMLACRYGTGDILGTGEPALSDTPETATEERLFQLLGQRLVRGLLARIAAGLGEAERVADDTELPMQRGVPADGAWLIKAAVYGPDDSLAGHLLFSLDEECMAGLLGRLAPERPAAAASEPVALEHALQLQIHARLLQKTVPLGHIMDLRPGRVIPVNLSDADVLIQDSVLFRATVVEHKGKLCLTSFSED